MNTITQLSLLNTDERRADGQIQAQPDLSQIIQIFCAMRLGYAW
ncbi:hypothetical protein BR10RB9215_C20853 [Brucella sp. 10RB9215]|nr:MULTISPECIES: hypothetical protein [unclassified Brucella]SBW16182.1 hypothetical protein BR10RB9215_C20853 [Brucella sp. 10RB9215]